MQRFIHHVRVELPAATEGAAEARARLADKFPRTALRRMTHLGMLLGSTLDGVALGSEDAVVYASSYAETRALEDFLASFPQASPLLFQTSIHPGGVQQVLIGRQQPVTRLWPLAGRARLAEQALLTALLEPAPRVVLLGGEERGSWLLDQGYASDRAFAFAVMLSREAAGAVGCRDFFGETGECGRTRSGSGGFRHGVGRAGAVIVARSRRRVVDPLVMKPPPEARRNPGPSWGYRFMLWAERWWPHWVFQPALMAGAWVGVARMPSQRACSREYLAAVLGRPPRLTEIWAHFYAFSEFLVMKLRAARGVVIPCTLAPENRPEFEALARSDRPALFGTFHLGGSDLLGYLLSNFERPVSVLRTRVGNSDDTRLLSEQFGSKVSFLWVNDPANFLFELKDALQAGDSLALKCDRLDFSARTEVFEFLGEQRLFPFTIYYLAVLFERPAVFCLGVPGPQPDTLHVTASPVFNPDPSASRKANLAAARVHFQGVLRQVEAILHRRPMLWFNFVPLNPVVPPTAPNPAP